MLDFLKKKKGATQPPGEGAGPDEKEPSGGGSGKKKPKFGLKAPKVPDMDLPKLRDLSVDRFRNLGLMDVITGGVSVIAVLVLAVMLVRNNASAGAFETRRAENDARIQTLTNQLAELDPDSVKKDDEDSSQDEEAPAVQVYSALEGGTKLAEAETEYTGRGYPGETLRYDDIAEKMAPYMTDGALNISTYSWFPYWVEPADPNSLRFFWKFESGYEFSNPFITGTWLCYNTTRTGSTLVGYALGTYTAESRLFSDIDCHVLNAGAVMLQRDNLGYDILNEFYRYFGVDAPAQVPDGDQNPDGQPGQNPAEPSEPVTAPAVTDAPPAVQDGTVPGQGVGQTDGQAPAQDMPDGGDAGQQVQEGGV